ncbi:MAG: hypothetical protein CMQ40_03235 [Gammaproteobacteria bacterium]|nr:hypothetical protein [Gammaproteobacteria bacterium]
MRSVLKTLATISVLVCSILVAYGLVATAPAPEQIIPEELIKTIRVVEAKQTRFELEVLSQGTVVPHKQSELVPEVSGRVSWMSSSLIVGGFFKKGDVLLRIDDVDYRATVDRANAKLKRARAEEELARYELERMQELIKRKLTSQSALESILRSHRIAQAALQEALINYEQTRRDLWRTEIKAPYEGLVRSEKVDLGQYLNKGQAIASIYASESAEVRLPLADRQLAFLDLPLGHKGELEEGKAPTVHLSTVYAGQAYSWEGKLVRTESEINSKTRMVTAVVRVKNTENPGKPDLPIGLFLNARIMGKWVENVVSLPRSALRNQDQILVVDKENKIYYRKVVVMKSEKDNVLISAGVSQGELVNISPIQTVVEGMKVNPVKQEIARL